MFDRNNPAHLAALKAEVVTDPTGRGYDPDGPEDLLMQQLNNPDFNLTQPKPSGPDFITPRKLLKALMPPSISSQDQFKIQLIFEMANTADDDITEFRSDILDLGGNVAAAIDTIVRDLSRAEILFAEINADGVTERVLISVAEWRAARDS